MGVGIRKSSDNEYDVHFNGVDPSWVSDPQQFNVDVVEPLPSDNTSASSVSDAETALNSAKTAETNAQTTATNAANALTAAQGDVQTKTAAKTNAQTAAQPMLLMLCPQLRRL